MSKLYWRRSGGASDEPVDEENPLPVQVRAGLSFRGAPVMADYLWRLGLEGRLFVASDGDQDDQVTGQTTIVNTTPTFLLSVPAGITAVPLFLNLSQTGTVAGGVIDVIIEIAAVDKYSTGGTLEGVFNIRTGQRNVNKCLLRSGATAFAGYGVRLFGASIGQDVSPAEGAVHGPFWKPELPYLLDGPASLAIFTQGATTGPTWYWSIGWAEFETRDLLG